ncbi:MAG: MotA/TolQ/ExbB proton channel family protein [Calditrichia bacterium]
MDLATIIGIFSGLGLIGYAILSNGDFSIFIDIPSMMIVGGGTIAATLIAYPLNEVLGVMKIAMKVFMTTKSNNMQLIEELARIASKAKQDGVLSLEAEAKKANHKLLQQGLMMISDGFPRSTIVKMLSGEITTMQERHKAGREIFTEMGKYAPAFGMVGTLIGLVQMLAALNDPSSIGPKMAVALITTFYGALLANLFFVPMATKLKRRSESEKVEMQLMIEGLLAIQEGENPKVMVDRLKVFLDSQLKEQVENKMGGGKAA